MTVYDTVLFDLDGTLTDSKPGITNSVMYALEKFGIKVDDRDSLQVFIGPPLIESFQKYYGFDAEKAKLAVSYYREYFAVTGLFENEVYQGIPELLANLKDKGKTLIIATSKPTIYSEKILKHFALYDYFSLVIGSNLDGTRVSKVEVIEHVLKGLNKPEKRGIVMVGDREHDINGALKNGIDSVGVAYGYGSVAELMDAKPTYLVNSVEELKNLLG